MSITIEEMQKQVHNLAREKGWWPIRNVSESGFQYEYGEKAKSIDVEKVNIPEKLILMVSEISEALEWYRNPEFEITSEVLYTLCDPHNEFDPEKPDGMWIELADCIIRILDLAGAYNIDMEELVKLKHNYNKTRPYRHGGKKC
jgi:NTP pyrophosphatase (non-canonical NTP hydrolase)